MAQNFGSVFGDLRKMKGIAINQIVGDDISHSQYHRFVSGKSDITLTKFLKMLNQVNVRFDEFLFICNQGEEDFQYYMQLIKQSFEAKEISDLRNLAHKCHVLFEKSNTLKFHHLFLIAKALEKRISNQSESYQEADEISNYLLNVTSWTHYEIVLFNNTFFIFKIELVNLLLKTAIKKAIQFDGYVKNTQELIKLYSNVIIYCLQIDKQSTAIDLIDEICKFPLDSNFMFEKILVYFWKNIKILLSSNIDDNTAIDNIDLILKFLQQIKEDKLRIMLKEILDYLQNN